MKWSHRYFLYYYYYYFYFFSFLFSVFMSCWRIVVAKLWEVPARKAQWLPEHAERAWPGRKKWRNVAARGKKNPASLLPSFFPPSKKSVWSAHAPRRSHGDTSPTLRRNVNTAGCVPLGVVGQLSQGKRLREVGGCAPSICASRRASLSLIVINLLSFAFFASLTPDSSVN